jgi:DNA adenine methylase
MPQIASNSRDGLQPVLKWAGGKRWLLPLLLSLRRGHERRRVVEPFCGGMAFTLAAMPERALLNDANPHLISLYREIRAGLKPTIRMRNDEGSYYSKRVRFNRLIKSGRAESAEAAQIFYYMNRTCFNGLCRYNARGLFNVPFGRYANVAYARDFKEHGRAFASWDFKCGDFASLEIDSDDFLYADPPFDAEFTAYTPGGFTWDDQVRAAEWLSKHRGPVVVSNQATPRVVSLYRKLGFKVMTVPAPRRIRCNGDRSLSEEVVAIGGLKDTP